MINRFNQHSAASRCHSKPPPLSVIPSTSRYSEEPSPCHSEEVARPTKNLIQGHSSLRSESIPAPKPLRTTRKSLFFSYFLVQESTKELLHGENGGIRLRSFAERARKTYAVPNTRSGRSLPRRTKPRHFHECGISQESFAGPAGAVALQARAGLRAELFCHSERSEESNIHRCFTTFNMTNTPLFPIH